MTTLKISEFGGLAPRTSEFNLNPVNATVASNCYLDAGDLRGIRKPTLLKQFSEAFNVNAAWRLPNSAGNNIWVAFENKNTSFLRGPLVNDSYDRYYWTDDTLGSYSIISGGLAVDNGDGTVGIPVTAHKFSIGDVVVIANTVNYNGTETIVSTTTNQINVTASYVSETFGADDTVTLTTPIDPKRAIVPKYNTLARIIAGSAAYYLGVPTPTSTPGLSVTGGSGDIVTRAYVYTWYSIYGEEGQPSDPIVVSGFENGSWDITGMDAAVPGAANRASGYVKKLYRTVTDSTGSADYYYVADISGATTTYSDTSSTSDIALNLLLESTDWAVPPTTLDGLVLHPDGFFVGFSGRNVHFSEPYRPHAWPAKYTVSVRDDIVALSIFGTYITVVTKGSPHVLSGTHPSIMTLTNLDIAEPCTSRNAVASIAAGTLYPSNSGIMLISSQGITNVTQQVYTRPDWRLFSLSNMNAAVTNDIYVVFDTTTSGLVYSPKEQESALTTVNDSIAFDIDNIQADPLTGDIFIIQNNAAYEWNPSEGLTLTYIWRTKAFSPPKPINFGAMRVDYEGTVAVAESAYAEYQAHNDIVFAEGKPLNPFNSQVLNASITTAVAGSNLISYRMPLNASRLFNIAQLASSDVAIAITIYGDDVVRAVVPVTSTKMRRLPTGYKTDKIHIEITGNTVVEQLKFAESPKGLANV